jgi:hypothetical protein
LTDGEPLEKANTIMKANRNGTKGRVQTLRVWTYDQVCKALPLITSIMRSVRERRIEAQLYDRRAEQLANLPGRPDRRTLIAHDEAVRESRRAREAFREVLTELHAFDVYCIDPIHGQAVIPFLHDQQLAWFLFDLFDDPSIRFWRYHTDSLETRRPLAEALTESDESTQVA